MEMSILKLIFQIATKTDLKNITHIDTSSFALKTNLAGLKLNLINQTSKD